MWRRLTGGLATVCTIAAFALQVYASWKQAQLPSSSWILTVFALFLFLFLFLFQDDTVRFRFRVLGACRRMKELSVETIEVAAGDCSWLARDLGIIRAKLDQNVKLRLLYRPGTDVTTNELIWQLATHRNAEVRQYESGFDTYLRCIIIDRNKPNAARMVLIDKESPSNRVLGIFTPPSVLRRDHSVTYIRPGAKAWKLIQHVFDHAFEHGTPCKELQVEAPIR